MEAAVVVEEEEGGAPAILAKPPMPRAVALVIATEEGALTSPKLPISRAVAPIVEAAEAVT